MHTGSVQAPGWNFLTSPLKLRQQNDSSKTVDTVVSQLCLDTHTNTPFSQSECMYDCSILVIL